MKIEKKDHLVRSVDAITWKKIKLLSVELEIPIAQVLKFLIEQNENITLKKVA